MAEKTVNPTSKYNIAGLPSTPMKYPCVAISLKTRI
jgi:hypothetical protein